MDAERITLAEFRKRVEFLRDHADPGGQELTENERGQVEGARNVFTLVLSMLDQVRCGRQSSLPTRRVSRGGTGPVLRLVRGGE